MMFLIFNSLLNFFDINFFNFLIAPTNSNYQNKMRKNKHAIKTKQTYTNKHTDMFPPPHTVISLLSSKVAEQEEGKKTEKHECITNKHECKQTNINK